MLEKDWPNLGFSFCFLDTKNPRRIYRIKNTSPQIQILVLMQVIKNRKYVDETGSKRKC